jgi:hypothetical protein
MLLVQLRRRCLPPRLNAVPKRVRSVECMAEKKLKLTSVMRGKRFHCVARNGEDERKRGVGVGGQSPGLSPMGAQQWVAHGSETSQGLRRWWKPWG